MKVQFRNLRLKLLPPVQRMKADADRKKIMFIAGRPSHGYAEHEFHAGCLLLAKWLKEGLPDVDTVVCKGGWPQDSKILDDADAIVLFADGGDANPMLPHLDEIAALMKRGVGLACIHYAVQVPKGKAGDLMKDWIGGYYEMFWSVNPFWTADFTRFAEHSVARGSSRLRSRTNGTTTCASRTTWTA